MGVTCLVSLFLDSELLISYEKTMFQKPEALFGVAPKLLSLKVKQKKSAATNLIKILIFSEYVEITRP